MIEFMEHKISRCTIWEGKLFSFLEIQDADVALIVLYPFFFLQRDVANFRSRGLKGTKYIVFFLEIMIHVQLYMHLRYMYEREEVSRLTMSPLVTIRKAWLTWSSCSWNFASRSRLKTSQTQLKLSNTTMICFHVILSSRNFKLKNRIGT